MGRGVGEKSAIIGIGIKALIVVIIIVFLFSSGCSNDFLDVIKEKIARDKAKDITAFSFLAANNGVLSTDVGATITRTDISATVPYGTDVTALVATFTTTGASVTVDATAQVSGDTANNFSSPVTYRVTAGDSSSQDYTITVALNTAVDYTISNPTFPSSGVTDGAFNGDFAITNLGTAVGNQTIDWDVYLSIDDTYDAGDTPIGAEGTGTQDPLAAGTSSPVIDFLGNWSSTIGTYYLIIVISAADDSNTSNNETASSIIPISIVDYTISNPTFPSSGVTDGAFNGDFAITNSGTAVGNQTIDWDVYLSIDDTYDAGDTPIGAGGTGTQDPLAAGTSSPVIDFSGNWPSTIGTYYLIIVISAADDSNTSNNETASSPIPIGIVDYTISNPTFPSSGVTDGAFNDDFAITNSGTAVGNQTIDWDVYLSIDDTYDAGDTPIGAGGTGTQDPLAAGTSSPVIDFSGNWPSTIGTYYLIIVISAADDSNTDNNETPSLPIPISAQAVRISVDDAFDSGHSKLALMGTEYGVAWSDYRDGNAEIYFARIDADGAKIVSDTRISVDDTYDSNGLSLVWTGIEYGVAWSDYRDGNAEIYFARIDSNGTKIGSDTRISVDDTYDSIDSSLVWTGTEYGVAWTDYRDVSSSIYFARIDANGTKIGNDTRISVDDTYSSRKPSLVWTGSEYGISWEDGRDADFEIYFARIDANGTKIGSGTRISPSDTYDSQSPSLIWTGTQFGLAWGDERDIFSSIYFARIDANGTKIGSDTRISVDDAYDSDNPSLVWTGTEFGVAWENYRDGDFWEIFFGRIDANGTKIGSDTRISVDDTYNSEFPFLVWTGSEYGISWEDGRDGNAEIYFAHF